MKDVLIALGELDRKAEERHEAMEEKRMKLFFEAEESRRKACVEEEERRQEKERKHEEKMQYMFLSFIQQIASGHTTPPSAFASPYAMQRSSHGYGSSSSYGSSFEFPGRSPSEDYSQQ